jgi:hypothetical protein
LSTHHSSDRQVNKSIKNGRKKHLAREHEKKKERTKVQTKRSHSKVQTTQWGSHKRRKHKTQDLNPSPAAPSKSCKDMVKKPERTPSLEEASLGASTAQLNSR